MAGEQTRISDLELVRQAVEMPGQMGPQYNYFRELSFGNQAYLYYQGAREIVGKFIDWKKVGRHVIAGSKAFEIIRPIFYKRETEDEEEVLRGFTGSRCMFTLSQTDGEAVPPIVIPKWDKVLAMGKLALHEVEFDSMSGNTQGFSRGLEYAVSPIAANPAKTMFHEWGHIICGHTMPDRHGEYLQHRGVMEAEAEITAMLVMKEFDLLDDDTASHSRAYCQHWLGGGEFPETSARRVLKAANAIIQAGRLSVPEPEA